MTKKEKRELKAITQKGSEGQLVAIASTEDIDRAGDSLKVEKWNFKNFLMNPVLQAGHDYRPQYTVGIAKNLRVEDRKVVFEPVFHEITPLAKQIKQMYEKGFLKAWSVGFIPGAGEKGLNELLEVSAVAVPANAFALMKSFESPDAADQLSQISLELKSWVEEQNGEIVEVENEAPAEEVVAPSATTLEDVKEKAVVEGTTGETNGHTHMVTLDDESGDGTTDEVEDHVHEIIGFEVQEANGHTHDLNTDDLTEVAIGENGMDDKPKKPKKKKTVDAWNPDLPAIFSKGYGDDVAIESNKASFKDGTTMEFLDCKIKDLYVNSYFVPSPLIGSYLAGFKSVLSENNLVETRAWQWGQEVPPCYEVIQLTADSSDDFLVFGTQFFKVEGKKGLVFDVYPTWMGLQVEMVTTTEDKEYNKEVLEKVHAWVKENNPLKGQKFALSGRFIPSNQKTWDDVILEKGQKDLLMKSALSLQTSTKSRGMLFIGAPGTGKTMTGKIMKDVLDTTFLWVSSKDMDRVGAVGGLSLAFKLARDLAPTVLFMEDIDNWLYGEVTDLLKTEMDGIEENKSMITILTSNNPERLPDALLDRPGRFHEILEFNPPTAEVRSQMIQKWADVDEVFADALAEKTEGFTGAYIKELVDYAHIIAEDEGIEILEALDRSLTKLLEQRQLIENIRQTRKSFDTMGAEVKEGRILSSKNRKTISEARDALDSVLKISEKADAEEDDGEQVKQIEAVAEKVAELAGLSDPEDVLLKALQVIAKASNEGLRLGKKARKTN